MGSASLQALAWAHLWYTWNRFQSLRLKLFAFRHQPSTALTSCFEEINQHWCHTNIMHRLEHFNFKTTLEKVERLQCKKYVLGDNSRLLIDFEKRLYPMKPETVYCAFLLSLVYLHIRKVFRGYLHSPKSHQWVTNITSRVPHETKNGHGSIFWYNM